MHYYTDTPGPSPVCHPECGGGRIMSWASSGSLQGIEQSGQHSGIVQASRLCLSSSALADTSAKVTGKEGHGAHTQILAL